MMAMIGMKKEISFEIIFTVEGILKERLRVMPQGSYATRLFSSGMSKILDKLGEEVTELMVAVIWGRTRDVTNEAADACFHLMLFMTYMNLRMDKVLPSDDEIKQHIAEGNSASGFDKEKLMSAAGQNCAMLIFLSNAARSNSERLDELTDRARQLFANIIILCLSRNVNFEQVAAELESRMKVSVGHNNNDGEVVH